MILATTKLNIVNKIEVFRMIWGRRIRIRRDFEPRTLVGGDNLQKLVRPPQRVESFFHKTFFILRKFIINRSIMNINCNFRWKMKKNYTTGYFYKKFKKIFFQDFPPETQNRYIRPQK
jgi:hypothetical protein